MTNQVFIRVKSFEIDKGSIDSFIADHLKKRSFPNLAVEVEVVGQKRITKLNEKFMKRSGPTDVLSFPLFKREALSKLEEGTIIGTVVICSDIIKMYCVEHKTSLDHEFYFMLGHGIDHLLGIHHK